MALATTDAMALATTDDLGIDWKPFIGLLVEIGQVDPIEPDPDLGAAYPEVGAFDVSGERGRCLAWAEDQQKYCVQTFSGYRVFVAEDQLREFDPPDPEEPGGFDVVWPTGALAQGVLASVVSERLTDQGYCVVQMFEGDAAAEEIAAACEEVAVWGVMDDEVEAEYLGASPKGGKVAWLPYGAPAEDGTRPFVTLHDLDEWGSDLRSDITGAVERADNAMTNVARLLWPLAPEWQDEKRFFAHARTNPMVRAGIAPDDPPDLKEHTFSLDNVQALENHIEFCESKRLCILYLVDNEGGDLVLTPGEEAYDYCETTIPLSKNKLVIFHCGEHGFTENYTPDGRHLSLQTWVLDEPTYRKTDEEALRVITGPEEPKGQRNNVMSIMTRYPGCSFEPLAYWSMVVSGGDTQILVPQSRWDVDIYYRKEHTIGFSMTCHGATLQQREIEQFDNKFFGINPEETRAMAPYMRIMLEVGYETLRRAGHDRTMMKGWDCGVFVGDSGSDWDSFCDVSFAFDMSRDSLKYRYAGRERSAACNRLSHIMGLKGPVSTAETACSSSLVAAAVAQMTMRTQQNDQKSPHISTGIRDGLIIGSNTIIGPGSYIALSGPGMLTSKGRCFTFDQSADGFARGEGVGGVKLKMCDNEIQARDRVAVLIGCCANQDGRSASMTAPHGPSQQEVIRNSMREGGLSAKMITIAECHGTGTALGDPIEVGALRGVMGTSRVEPILKTTAKANIGHLEAAAGVAGLIKCICMMNFSCGAPNCHLVTLNPHLDVVGFPAYFETESVDYGTNSGLTGVSSFGFGGTNARADVWANASKGPHYSISGTTLQPKAIICS